MTTIVKSIQTRESASERVARVLADRIIDGQVPLGTYLPTEAQLCIEFGVSRIVVRESIRILVGKQLVESQPGRGVIVSEFASEELLAQTFNTLLHRRAFSFEHLWRVRVILEVDAARLAAKNRTLQQLHVMRETILAMQNPAAKLEDLIEADVKFHNIVAEATGNPLTALIFQALASVLRASRKVTIAATGGQKPMAEHHQLLDAIERGDSDEAHRLMFEHLRSAKQDIDLSGPIQDLPESGPLELASVVVDDSVVG